MEQKISVIQAISEFLFGRKYYANIISTKGINKYEICSFIFSTKKAAEAHARRLKTTVSFQFVETISFRSRRTYPALNQ